MSEAGAQAGAAGVKAGGDFLSQLVALREQREQRRIQNELERRKRLADAIKEGSNAQSQTLNQIVQNVSRGLL